MTKPNSQATRQALQEAARHRTVLDVGGQRVAKVYAEALYNAAAQHEEEKTVLDELQALVEEVFTVDPQLESFFAAGALPRDRKAAALKAAFDGRAGATFNNFLQVLNNHDRLDLLRGVLAAYRELADVRANRVRVEVRTAVPLSDDQRHKLEAQLRQSFGKEPLLAPKVEPDLLGGMIVRVGDWLYDASVRTRLDQIRKQVLTRSSHEIQSGRDRFSHLGAN